MATAPDDASHELSPETEDRAVSWGHELLIGLGPASPPTVARLSDLVENRGTAE